MQPPNQRETLWIRQVSRALLVLAPRMQQSSRAHQALRLLHDTVARLRECLSEAATSGKLAAVLGAMPKKTEIPKAEVASPRNPKAEVASPRKEEDPEDPGSEVDWGNESAKEEEEPSSEYEEVAEEEVMIPLQSPDLRPIARNLSGTRRSRKVREEIKPTLERSGWGCNRCGASNLALRDRCYKCSYGIIARFS